MDWLIWSGAAVSGLGLAGLIWCIVKGIAARRAGLDDAALKARIQRLVTVNLAAFLLSALGLLMVVIGIILG